MKRIAALIVLLCSTTTLADPPKQPIQEALDKQPTGRPAYLDLRTFAKDGVVALNDTLRLGHRPYGVIIDGYGVNLAYVRGEGRPVIDATGTHRIVMRDCTVTAGNPTNLASCGILLARTGPSVSAGLHLFENVCFGDYFSVAAVVNVGSESNEWNHCMFNNFGGSRVAYIACTTPPPGIKGAEPNEGGLLAQVFYNCHWFVNCDNSGSAIAMIVRSTSSKHYVMGDITIHGGTFSAGPIDNATSKGDCGILLDAPDVVFRQMTIDGVRFETDPCRNVIRKTLETRPAGLNIRNCTLISSESNIFFPGTFPLGVVGKLTLENNTYRCRPDKNWGYKGADGKIDTALRPNVVIGALLNSKLDVSGILYESQRRDAYGEAINWPSNAALVIDEARSCEIQVDGGREKINKNLNCTVTGVEN